MKKRKPAFWITGITALWLCTLLTGCITRGASPTATPTTGGGVAYPAYPGPAETLPPYPGPEETLSPDGEVTSPGVPPAGQPLEVPQPYAPQPMDAGKPRGQVFLEPNQQDILTLESFPPQFNLVLKGELPTPCHELRVTIEPPNDRNEIIVTPYSVADPAKICTQVLEPFDATIPLRGMPAGTYTVVVDGAPVGEITVP